jgi:transposase InsO family protein
MPGLELSKPSRVFASDVTEIRLRHGKAYLASIIDVCTRQILGWNLSKVNDTQLTLGALDMVLSSRKLEPGWVHHSDRGSNYGADLYRAVVRDHGGILSYSDPGSPTQNAYAESFFSTFKLEAANEEVYENLQDACQAIKAYFLLYNSTRRHSSIGCIAPDQYYAEICLR